MSILKVKAIKSKKDGSVMAWLPSGQSVFWSADQSKPDYRNKYVTINCCKYQLEWVK